MSNSLLLKKEISAKGQMIFFILLGLLPILLLIKMPRIAIPFAVAYVLTFILDPVMGYLVKMRINKTLASLLIVFGMILFIAYPIAAMIPKVSSEIQNLQNYLPAAEKVFQEKYGLFVQTVKVKTGHQLPSDFATPVTNYLATSGKKFMVNVPSYIGMVFEWSFVIPFFLFFMLRDKSAFKRLYLKFVPNSIFEKTYFLVFKFQEKLGGYILAKFIEAMIVGIVLTAGLLFLDVRFAIILGLIGMLTNIIPYIGPILGTLPAFAVVFIDHGWGNECVALLILYTIANMIDLVIIFPLLMSKIVDMHPLIVIVSVIIGSQYMGIVGMVISIPVAASIKLILTEVYKELYSIN